MTQTSALTQGEREGRSKYLLRVIIISSFSIITALSSAVSIVYWQDSKTDRETIKYERGQKEVSQREAQDCAAEKLAIVLSLSKENHATIQRQDTLKTLLKNK